jgi:hypothetical protein
VLHLHLDEGEMPPQLPLRLMPAAQGMVVTEEVNAVVSEASRQYALKNDGSRATAWLADQPPLANSLCILARKNIFGTSVEFEGGDIICGSLLNRSLLAWRKLACNCWAMEVAISL